MANLFEKILENSTRMDMDRYATDFGGIVDAVVNMLTSDQAAKTREEARAHMEKVGSLPNGMPRLFRLNFGDLAAAPELAEGKVAAVDGTNTLPLQKYAAGQALCVGIGSVSHRREMGKSLHAWSSNATFREGDTESYLKFAKEGLFGISQTAYLRYYEGLHGLEIEEPVVFFDGPLVYEWLASTREGIKLYLNLLRHPNKRCIGIIKSLSDDIETAWMGKALHSGEVFVRENLFEHLNNNPASNKNHGEGGTHWAFYSPDFRELAQKVVRGIFKPRHKAFGFEVHMDHAADLLRIMAADCQMNRPGHEIPYLLNRVDQQVRATFGSKILKDRIAAKLREHSEELFFGETDERSFR
jgi:hypothetical protein